MQTAKIKDIAVSTLIARRVEALRNWAITIAMIREVGVQAGQDALNAVEDKCQRDIERLDEAMLLIVKPEQREALELLLREFSEAKKKLIIELDKAGNAAAPVPQAVPV